MPRRPRQLAPGGTYHVRCHGNNGTPIFRDDADRASYLALLDDIRRTYDLRLYHYVLMPDHVHLVLRDVKGALSAAMKRLNHSYTYYVKRKYDFIGRLWRGRFEDDRLTDDDALLTCGIAIELAPALANLVRHPLDHPWSSFSYYAEGMPNELLTPNPGYVGLASREPDRRRIYRLLARQWLAEK